MIKQSKYAKKLSSNHSERSYASRGSSSSNSDSGGIKHNFKATKPAASNSQAKPQKPSYPQALPETIAFIVTNSIDQLQQQSKGITNISNTINIYSTHTTNLIADKSEYLGPTRGTSHPQPQPCQSDAFSSEYQSEIASVKSDLRDFLHSDKSE